MASMDVSVDPLPEDMSMQLSNEHLEDAMTHTPKGRLFSFLSHAYTNPVDSMVTIPPAIPVYAWELPYENPDNIANPRGDVRSLLPMTTETKHDVGMEVPQNVIARMEFIFEHLRELLTSCIPETCRFREAYVKQMATETCCGYTGPIFAFALMELLNLKPIHIRDLTERASTFYGNISVYSAHQGIMPNMRMFVDLGSFDPVNHDVYYFILVDRGLTSIYHHFATIFLGDFILIIDAWQAGDQGNRKPWGRLMRIRDFYQLLTTLDTTVNGFENQQLLDVFFRSPHYIQVRYVPDPLFHVRFIRMDRANPAIPGLFHGVGGKTKKTKTKKTKIKKTKTKKTKTKRTKPKRTKK